jgi:hypothetical protein
VRFLVVLELPGRDALRRTPVCLGDVVLDVLTADAPLAAAADLDGSKLAGLSAGLGSG